MIGSDTKEIQTRVRKVRLTQYLGRAKIGQQAVLPGYSHRTAPNQGDGLTNPEAGIRTRNLRIFQNRIKTLINAIVRVLIPAGVNDRNSDSVPVEINGAFIGGEPRTHVSGFTRKGAAVLCPCSVVPGCRQVKSIKVPIAVVTHITNVIVPGLIGPNQCRSLGKPVLVVVIGIVAFPVHVVDPRQLGGKSTEWKVLTKYIDQIDVIVSRGLRDIVQTVVDVLFKTAEPRDVVLPTVIVAITEKAHAQGVIQKEEASEINVHRLDTHTDAVKVISRRDILNVIVNKGFLETDPVNAAVLASSRIDVQEAVFLCMRVVVVDDRRHPKLPFRRHEDGVTLVHVDRQDEVLVEHQLGTPAEKIQLTVVVQIRGTHLRGHRCWNLAGFKKRVGDTENVDEPVIENRVIALQRITVVGIPNRFIDQIEVFGQTPAVRRWKEVRSHLGRRRINRLESTVGVAVNPSGSPLSDLSGSRDKPLVFVAPNPVFNPEIIVRVFVRNGLFTGNIPLLGCFGLFCL